MLEDVPFLAGLMTEVRDRYPHLDPDRFTHEIMRRQITRMVEDVIAVAQERLKQVEPQSVEDIRAASMTNATFSDQMAETDKAIKKLLFSRIYRHPDIMRIRAAAGRDPDGPVQGLYERPDADEEPLLGQPYLRPQRRPEGTPCRRLSGRHDRHLCGAPPTASCLTGLRNCDRQRQNSEWTRVLGTRAQGHAMNLFADFETRIKAALDEIEAVREKRDSLDFSRIVVEPPRDASHGDAATNAAMVLAKGIGMNPRALADLIGEKLKQDPDVAEVGVAGPGFINTACRSPIGSGCSATMIEQGTISAARRSARATRSMSNMSRPIRPDRCMSAIAAAPWSVTRWPTCWALPATR